MITSIHMPLFLYALISVGIVSAVSLVGVLALSLQKNVLSKYLFILISLAAGALLGDAFIHLIPEAFEELSNPLFISLAILGGIFLFFIVEKFLHWHHHGEHTHTDHIHPVGHMILISDGLHNFIDGIIIAAAYLVSIPVGIATTVAVILHEIPQEIGDFGVLIHAGYSRKRALWLNFLSALFALAGVIVGLILGAKIGAITVWFLPIAAGGFIYIAMADLIPELHKTSKTSHSLLQILIILIGIATMVGLTFLE